MGVEAHQRRATRGLTHLSTSTHPSPAAYCSVIRKVPRVDQISSTSAGPIELPTPHREELVRERVTRVCLGKVPLMVNLNGDGNARMTVSEEEPDSVTIVLEGELDIASVEMVRRGIETYLVGSPRHVVFDLARLQFIDSSGIALLIEVANQVASVEVRHSTPIVRRVLEVTGLVDALGVTD